MKSGPGVVWSQRQRLVEGRRRLVEAMQRTQGRPAAIERQDVERQGQGASEGVQRFGRAIELEQGVAQHAVGFGIFGPCREDLSADGGRRLEPAGRHQGHRLVAQGVQLAWTHRERSLDQRQAFVQLAALHVAGGQVGQGVGGQGQHLFVAGLRLVQAADLVILQRPVQQILGGRHCSPVGHRRNPLQRRRNFYVVEINTTL